MSHNTSSDDDKEIHSFEDDAQNKDESNMSIDQDTGTQCSLFSSQKETDPVAIFQLSTEPIAADITSQGFREDKASSLVMNSPPHIIPSTPSKTDNSSLGKDSPKVDEKYSRKRGAPCRQISFSPKSPSPSPKKHCPEEPAATQQEADDSWDLHLSESTQTDAHNTLSGRMLSAAPDNLESPLSDLCNSSKTNSQKITFDLPKPLSPPTSTPQQSSEEHSVFTTVRNITSSPSQANACLDQENYTPLSSISQDSIVTRSAKSVVGRQLPVISQSQDDLSFLEGEYIPESSDSSTGENRFRYPPLPPYHHSSTPHQFKDQSVQVDMDICPHCNCLSIKPALQALNTELDFKKTYSITYVSQLTTNQLVTGGEVVKTSTVKKNVKFHAEEVTEPVVPYSFEVPLTFYFPQPSSSSSADASSSFSHSSEISKSSAQSVQHIPAIATSATTVSHSPEMEPSKKRFRNAFSLPSPPKIAAADLPPEDIASFQNEERCPSPEIPLALDKNPPSSTILPGIRVMARWKDGYYYPGSVECQDSDASSGRWIIHFDDGDRRSIWRKDLIPVDPLREGQSVMTEAIDGYFDPGIIRGYYRQDTEIGYIVESDTGETKRCSRSKVILTSDQAASLISPSKGAAGGPSPSTPSHISSNISLENMVEGKRRQRRPTGSLPNTPSPLSTRKQKIRQRPPHDPNLDLSDSSTSKSLSPISRKGRPASRTKLTPLRRTPSSKDVEPRSLNSALGPLPPKGSQIFKGYAFLLSYVERQPASVSSLSDSSGSDDSRVYVENDVPYNKNYLRKQISLGGGIVLDRFEETQTTTCEHIYLLAESHLRTIKYIQCLASGIPCISHVWVKSVCIQGHILDYKHYLLPAGFSIISNSLMEWHGRKRVLEHLSILVTSGSNPQFAEMWTPVLLAAQAKVVHKYPALSPSKAQGKAFNVDVIVTDPSCPKAILHHAQINKIPLVSTEWVIQSLINGFCLPYNDHPKFVYTYTHLS